MFEATIGFSGRAARAVAACVLLPLSASAGWASEAPVAFEPAQLVLTGDTGAPMRLLFEVTARAKVAKVTFEPSFLRRADDSSVWIAPESVTFKPTELSALEAGARRDVEVSLTSVPEPGTYEGVIRIAFDADTLPALEVPISVVAAEPPIGLIVTPSGREIRLGGLTGTSAFRESFTLKATRKVSALTFTPGSLRDDRTSSWIASQSVTVTPSVTSLEKGEERTLEVAVSGVTSPGLFKGSLAIGRAGSAETLELGLSVDAVKLEPIPPTLELPVANRLMRRSGARDRKIRATLQLTQDVPRLDSEVLRGLGPEFHLDPLQHATKKSKVIDFGEVQLDPKAPAGDGAQAKLSLLFSVPEGRVTPGSYTGKLRVLSPSQGSVMTIPVEVKVRDPQWLAWLLMVGGIVISWVVSFWKTKGRKRNALRGVLGRLQHDLANAATTARGRAEIEGLIATGHRLLTLDDLTKAESHITGIRATLTTAIATKQGLVMKLAEVGGLATPLDELRALVQRVLGTATGRVFRYLDDITRRLEGLASKIRREDFASAADPTLTQAESGLRAAISTLRSATDALERAGIRVGDIAALFQEEFPAEAEIGKDLERHHLDVFRQRLERIERPEDVAALTTDSQQLAGRLKSLDERVRRLGAFHAYIERNRDAQHPFTASSALIANFVQELRIGQVPAEAPVEAIWTTIEGERPGAGPAPKKEEGVAAGLFDSASEALGGLGVEALQAPQAPEAQEERGWLWLTNLLSPEAKERLVTFLLYTLALAILVPIGMDKTYLNNDTFGGLMSYLAVFLWGFGIQAGTATAAGILTKVKG